MFKPRPKPTHTPPQVDETMQLGLRTAEEVRASTKVYVRGPSHLTCHPFDNPIYPGSQSTLALSLYVLCSESGVATGTDPTTLPPALALDLVLLLPLSLHLPLPLLLRYNSPLPRSEAALVVTVAYDRVLYWYRHWTGLHGLLDRTCRFYDGFDVTVAYDRVL